MKRMVAVAISWLSLLCGGLQVADERMANGQTLQRPAVEPPVAVDRPTQRWLPLPQGDGVDQNSQARLLQQLQDLITSEASGAPLPKLSEAQLQQMERALEQLRQEIGEDKLPNLEDIPKEWINEALADPLIRKQAQQLLEQYARDRKLPTPPRSAESSSRTASRDAVPFPRRQPPANDRPSNSGARQVLPDRDQNGAKKDANGEANGGKTNELRSDRNQSSDHSLQPELSLQPDRGSSADRLDESGLGNSGLGNSGLRGVRPERTKPLEPKPLEQADAPEDGTSEASGSEGTSSIPKKPDAERIEALRQLFEKLKKIEGDKKANDPGAAAAAPRGTPPNRSPNPSPNATRPGTSTNRTNRATNPTPRLNNPIGENGRRPQVPSVLPDEQQLLLGDDVDADAQGSAFPKLDENPSGANSELRPDNPLLQDPTVTPTDPAAGSANSNKLPGFKSPTLAEDAKAGNGSRDSRQQSKALPGQSSRSPKAAGEKQDGTNRGSQLPNAGGGNAKGASQASEGAAMDLKTQLERQGLGSALKSLVEKTLREQGEFDSKQKESGAKGAERKGANGSAKETGAVNKGGDKQAASAQKSASKSNTKPSELANSKAVKEAQKAPSAAQPKSDAGQSSSMSGLKDLAAQVWGAIRTTPGEGSNGADAKSQSSGGGDSGAELGFSWGGAAWMLGLAVLVMLGLFLLLAKKRIEQATAAREAQATVAKELLADGIRTRADVVRAFHRFVLRRAQPVAMWWNHRYVASRLTQATPQLSSVILDLASVYEQARYMPPEVELSSDDLNRVQVALKQCVAGNA